MKEMSNWIKNLYGFEEFESAFSQIWCASSRIVGFVYKNSYFCNNLRKRWEYIPYTFQFVLKRCKIEGNTVFFNNRTAFHYPLLKVFIWMFDPNHAIIEVNLDGTTPLIVSAPDIPFEMVLSSRVIDDEIELKEET